MKCKTGSLSCNRLDVKVILLYFKVVLGLLRSLLSLSGAEANTFVNKLNRDTRPNSFSKVFVVFPCL